MPTRCRPAWAGQGNSWPGSTSACRPDITTLAKGLGGGLPIGAVLVSEKLKDVMGPSSHGSTFGGNPVVCAGANQVMKKVADDKFLREVAAKGDKLRSSLLCCGKVAGVTANGHDAGHRAQVRDQRRGAPKPVLEKGLLVLTAKEKVRLLPPLTITDERTDRGPAHPVRTSSPDKKG